MTQTVSEKSKLFRGLYLAARRCLHEDYINDDDAVKIKRDFVCEEMFGRSYNELTVSELVDVINELDVQSGTIAPTSVKILATRQQIKMFRFYAIACAIHYYDFKDMSYRDQENNFIYVGDELRIWLKKKFDKKDGFIPENIYRHLFENWINPKSHRFLIEGMFKKFAKNYNHLHYEYLSPTEMQYLITRYQAIYNNLTDYKYKQTNDFLNN